MIEALWGERALGCSDRGLIGGFSASLARRLAADAALGADERGWAQAAVTSYRLKTTSERHDVCTRLESAIGGEETKSSRRGGEETKSSGLQVTDAVDALAGVGPKVAERLSSLGLRTIGDLLEHVPRAYHDRRTTLRIADLRVGQQVTVVGTVRDSHVDRTRSGRRALRIRVFDGSGYLECLWWNQDWRARQLPPGAEAAFSGTVETRSGRPRMTNPEYDVVSSGASVSTGRLVPVYPASEQMPAATLRQLLYNAFSRVGEIPDPVPAQLRTERNLMGRATALRLMHFPDDPAQVADARRRLVFEELLTMQVGLALRKRHLERTVRGVVHDTGGPLAARFLETLPFAPTGAQARAVREIAVDMGAARPMHRLLQGEVGSGKTVVAVHAALVAAQSGMQAAIMAPTEVLAEQHARKIRELVEPLGVDVALLTSSVAPAVRRDALMRLAAGDIPVACGTHALLSEDVEFRRLGLAVVDEQHRFGVEHRIRLRSKGADPDVLIMTATPIPRTLALTLYGDLDVSILDELPAGRRPVATVVVPSGDDRGREQAYALIRSEVTSGRRAYVICALVDESSRSEARAAVAEAERLRSDVFPDLQVGLLHGQMPSREKDRVMEAFRSGTVSVLIATTVVEVGVDVPEATVMLIENADRFGLSQLHQLRGRVGRGEAAATCILFADRTTPDAGQRLDAIASSNDGFELAEADLRIRGEGTLFGTRQAGMPDLKLTRLVDDFPIVVEAREAAFALVDSDPRLEARRHADLRAEVSRRFEGVLDWLFQS